MSSTLTLKVASVTSPADLNKTGKTDAEVANILEYFIADWASPMPDGLTTAQANQWKLDQANARLVDYMRSTARANRLKQLRAQQASIETQADTETQL